MRHLTLALFVLVVSGGSLAAAQTAAEDAKRLLALKAIIKISNPGVDKDPRFNTWAGTNPCSPQWLGISCRSNRVVTISMRHPYSNATQLTGSLPKKSLFSGSLWPDTLEYIDFYGQNFIELTGLTFSSWLADVPATLKYIDLSGNTLPNLGSSWARLTALTTLKANTVTLAGLNLASLVNSLPTGLQGLELYRNPLGGPAIRGAAWSRLTALKSLQLSASLHTGLFPTITGMDNADSQAFIDKLPISLTNLDFNSQDAGLKGPIPNFSRLTSLASLTLHSSQLTSTLPAAKGDLFPASLKNLIIYNNRLTGTLPTWPGATDTTVYILPGNVAICSAGQISSPPAYKNYNTLKTMVLPEELDNCEDRDILFTWKDAFTGSPLMANWLTYTSPCASGWTGIFCDDTRRVTTMNLRGPSISLSLRLGGLRTGVALLLRINLSNPPEGTLPLRLPAKLVSLDLSYNGLNFELNEAWELPDTLRILILSNNNLKGQISQAWFDSLPSKLGLLYLHSNYIGGKIPTTSVANPACGALIAYILPMSRETLPGGALSAPLCLTDKKVPEQPDYYDASYSRRIRAAYLPNGGNCTSA